MRLQGDDLYLGLAVALVATGTVLAFVWVRRTGRRLPLLHATAVAIALVMLSGVQTLRGPSPHSLDVVSAIEARPESLLPPPAVRGERPSTALSPATQLTPPARMTVVPVPTTAPSPPVPVPLPRARTVPQPAAVVLGTTTVAPTVATTAAPTATTTTIRRRQSGHDDD